jgi:hypothetical protein
LTAFGFVTVTTSEAFAPDALNTEAKIIKAATAFELIPMWNPYSKSML